MPNQNLTAALGYLARGWSVVSVVERGKRPIVRWQTFEDRHPTEAEVRGWFERWPPANVAVPGVRRVWVLRRGLQCSVMQNYSRERAGW